MCDPVSIGYGLMAVATVGSAVYSADQSRKSQHEAMDAAKEAQASDARQKAELTAGTAMAANSKFAQDRRARLSNVLALGSDSTPTGNGTVGGPALGAGQSTTSGPVTGSVLGSGGAGGGYTPRAAGSVLSQAGAPDGAPRKYLGG